MTVAVLPHWRHTVVWVEYFCEQSSQHQLSPSATVRLCYYRYEILPFVKSLNNLSNTLHVSRSATIITPHQLQIFQSKFCHILEGSLGYTQLLPTTITWVAEVGRGWWMRERIRKGNFHIPSEGWTKYNNLESPVYIWSICLWWWHINIAIGILDIIHCPDSLSKTQLNSLGLSVPHRKHIAPPLRAQQVNGICRFVTMVINITITILDIIYHPVFYL
jgi:hypothetical protein